jgi:RNA-directed DNA polymerase
MTKQTITLQELRRRIYIKAKAEKTWRFWGLYVHVTKMETLEEAYKMAKRNNGAPGIDGVSFKEIEERGVQEFLKGIREELISETYLPTRNRIKEIPKENGKTRTLGIPTIRDRVVQGALKLILEPIFEADFQEGSYGYRPKRTAHQAVSRVTKAVVTGKTKVIDVDLSAYFETIRHHILLGKVAKRVNDNKIMRLLKLILKANGKKGVSQGGLISPLLSNIYLNEIDQMLGKAKEYTRKKDGYYHIEYSRFADDIVVQIDGFCKWNWLVDFTLFRLKQEFEKIDVKINLEKTKIVDLTKGETFKFLGFNYRRVKTFKGKWGVHKTPVAKARTNLTRKLKEVFKRFRSQPVEGIISRINPILRGWVNYYRVGNSSKCFSYVKSWVDKKIRRHLMRAKGRKGFGWNRWSNRWLYQKLNLYTDYKIRYFQQ